MIWVERLFVMGGVAALMWCGFMIADAYIAQRVARETLESMPAKLRMREVGHIARLSATLRRPMALDLS